MDTHVHPPDFLPGYARGVLRWFTRRTRPADVGFDQLAAAGVDAVIANAVGDLVGTAWWARPPWQAVMAQTGRIRAQTERADGVLATHADQVREAWQSRRTAVVLGLEGGDAIGTQLSRLDALFGLGVRLLAPVHFSDNRIGTARLLWHAYVGHLPIPRRRHLGLTGFGRRVIERMNALGMIIDVSHSDAATLHDIVGLTRQPVIASHSGAKSIEAFDRFLDNEEIVAVARTGGLVGLWPYRYKGSGAADLGELMRHARHVAKLVGAAHLCVGTDMNGVPGVAAGYRGERDVRLIRDHLADSGFGPEDVEGIMGGNFMRVFDRVTQAERSRPVPTDAASFEDGGTGSQQ